MTREEAIKILSARDNRGLPITWQDGFVEAYDMAIKSLEAWDSILSEIDRMFSVGFMNSTALYMSVLYRNLIKKHLLGVEK